MDPKPSISKHFSNISSIYPEKISTWKNKVFLSFDIDWAHDEVLKDTIEIVKKANVASTWFVTHDTPVIEGLHFVIWTAEIVNDYENFSAVPGQVTKIGGSYIEVACKDSKLRILLAECSGTVDVPTAWVQSIRKRFT